MLLLKKNPYIRRHPGEAKSQGQQVGFVPTMGALHKGHISLIESSVKANSITVCSIFVNPRQFNDPKDFEKYPITLDKDILMLEAAGCDIVFIPSVNEIYPEDQPVQQHYDLGYLETVLEGKYRQGHFQGVCMVVDRLLDIVKPDNLYLGQKDYQQCMVIRRLIELTGQGSIKTHICPTLREADGLAMSSRNVRLNQEERERAPAIYRSLQYIKENLQPGDLKDLKEKAAAKLSEQHFKIDYIEIADASTLQLIDQWDGRQKLVALAAAFLSDVRLIDNLLLNG